MNDLLSDDLAPLFHDAARTDRTSAWFGHIPFAHWVVRQVRPKIIVELGTHAGVSYSAFCSAVLREGLTTRCFAVDTWQGDDHAGHYSDAVYDEFSRFNAEHYGAFSTLLRKTFDEALDDIDDNSIDLLHIDGFHSYDAVQHDFVTWAPKLSDRAIVLLHDTNERREGFGVWQYWAELRKQYPAFEFLHSHGLGVLCVGGKASDTITALCGLSNAQADRVRDRFEGAGDRWVRRAGQRRLQSTVKQLKVNTESLQAKLNEQVSVMGKLAKRATVAKAAAARKATKKINGISEELEQARRANTVLVSQNNDLQTKLKEAREEVDDAKKRLVGEQNFATGLSQEKQHLLNSVPWWMIAPLRIVTNLKLNSVGWSHRSLIQLVISKWQLQREIKTLIVSSLFDRNWYLETYPDVATAGMDPLHHYCEFGWREGRDPCPEFSTKNYLLSNPDVLMEQINPLLHYHKYGQYEIRPSLLKRDSLKDITELELLPTRTPNNKSPKYLFREKLIKNIKTDNIEEIDYLISNYYSSSEKKPTQILIVECYCALKAKHWSKANNILNLLYEQKSQPDLFFEFVSNEIIRKKNPNENFFRELKQVNSNKNYNICVYTTIFGPYDTLMPVLTNSKLVHDFICFTDQDLPDLGWSLIKGQNHDGDSNLNAKEYKIKPHKYLDEYELSLFVDGNTILHGRVDELIEKYLVQSKFSMWRHPQRSDIMVELIAIAVGRRHDPEAIEEICRSRVRLQ